MTFKLYYETGDLSTSQMFRVTISPDGVHHTKEVLDEPLPADVLAVIEDDPTRVYVWADPA